MFVENLSAFIYTKRKRIIHVGVAVFLALANELYLFLYYKIEWNHLNEGVWEITKVKKGNK